MTQVERRRVREIQKRLSMLADGNWHFSGRDIERLAQNAANGKSRAHVAYAVALKRKATGTRNFLLTQYGALNV